MSGTSRLVWTVCVVCVALGCESDPTPKSPPRNREPAVGLVLTRWAALADSLEDVSRPERASRLRAFLTRDVSMAVIHDLCRDESADETRLGTLVRAYGDMVAMSPEDVVDLITDEDVSDPCVFQAVRQAQAMRDVLSRTDADAIGDAMLAASERRTGREARDMEVYAAQFGRSDALRARMVAYLASDVDSVLARGVAMARESRDDAVGELLARTLGRVAPRIETFPVSGSLLVSATARALGPEALPHLEPMLKRTHAPNVQNLAIEAMGDMPAGATLNQLYRLYPDRERTPVSSKDLPPGGVRDRYEALYDAVRRLQSFLAKELQGGSERESAVALELLDRASRFGPMVEPARLAAALRSYAARGFTVDRDRIESILSRLET